VVPAHNDGLRRWHLRNPVASRRLFLFAIFASWLTVIVVVFGVAMLMQFPLLFLVKLWLDQQAEYEAVGPHDTNPMNTIPLGSFSAGNDSHLTDNSHH
jgi:hypothetical protein